MLVQAPVIVLALGAAAVTLAAPVPDAINDVKAVFAQRDAASAPVAREAVPEPKAVFAIAREAVPEPKVVFDVAG